MLFCSNFIKKNIDFFGLLCWQCCWHFIIFRNNFVRYLTRQHRVSLLLTKTSRYYGGTEVTCICFYLSCAHNIISQSLNTYIHKCCLKSTDSRNDFILSYWNAKCLYFGTKVYIHCWISSTSFDKCSQSFLFTLVNNKISIINTPFFSWRHLIRRKVKFCCQLGYSPIP